MIPRRLSPGKKKERDAMNYPVGLSIENSLERKGEKNLRLV